MGNYLSSYEQPEFETLEANEKYELRRYKTANWTSTTSKAETMEKGKSPGFSKLFKYITGMNEGNNKISMTIPVTMAVKEIDDEMEVTMSFFVPKKFQSETPAPTGDGVYTETRKEFDAYVRTFGGKAYSKDWKNEFANLKSDLKADGIDENQFDMNSGFYAVSYDSPFKLFFRHNEVWIKRKSDSVNHNDDT